MLIYSSLTPWYDLLDPVADHEDEAACYLAALRGALPPGPATLLELGAGAGNNAHFLKKDFACTLTDISNDMLDRSRAQNPDCLHIQGDMRTLRLDQTFDAVLIHDAIVYMTSEADLKAAIETAFVHTRPGGVALIAPDHTRETFEEATALYEQDDPATGRALRVVEWSWDPNPEDDTCATEYVFVMRHGDRVEVSHDRHVEGLFPRETWLRLITQAGFEVSLIERILPDEEWHDQIFSCRRPR